MSRWAPLIGLCLIGLVGCSSTDATKSGEGSRIERTGSNITLITGDHVKVMIASLKGDSSSIGSRFTLNRDPKSECLTDGTKAVALPPGTKLQGSGDAVTVISRDGERFHLGDTVQGGGDSVNEQELTQIYGSLPTACGPPPWVVLHDHLMAPKPGQ